MSAIVNSSPTSVREMDQNTGGSGARSRCRFGWAADDPHRGLLNTSPNMPGQGSPSATGSPVGAPPGTVRAAIR